MKVLPSNDDDDDDDDDDDAAFSGSASKHVCLLL